MARKKQTKYSQQIIDKKDTHIFFIKLAFGIA